MALVWVGGYARDERVVTGEADGTRYFIGKVAAHRPAVITAACQAIVNLRSSCVAVVVRWTGLVAGIHLLSVLVWVEVAPVLGIAMTEAGSAQSLAIVVDDHGTEADLVTSVPVDIGNRVVVVALAVPGRTRRVAVPAPALGELMGGRVYVESDHLMARVDAASHENAWFLTV